MQSPPPPPPPRRGLPATKLGAAGPDLINRHARVATSLFVGPPWASFRFQMLRSAR